MKVLRKGEKKSIYIYINTSTIMITNKKRKRKTELRRRNKSHPLILKCPGLQHYAG